MSQSDNIAAELLEPIKAHDGMSFDELRRAYNFENISHRSKVFTRLIIDECRARGAAVKALDIGCGKGIELRVDYQWAIRSSVAEYWGIEPDPAIAPPPRLFDRYFIAVVEEADLPKEHFDIAYSFMVMEHVTDPEGFIKAVHRCLKPGGAYLFATPNARHYFTRTASLLKKLRVDELVLRHTVGEAADEYHYPVQYRFNSERRIRETALKIGFDEPEFVYVEDRGPIGYFPKPLRLVYHLLRLKRKVLKNPRSLVTMFCRMSKPR